MRLICQYCFLPLIMMSACASTNTPAPLTAQTSCDDIWTINSITVQPDREAQAIDYYEAAWLPARVIAKRDGAIKDFHLLKTEKRDQPTIQLVTLYEDSDQFERSEDAFQAIFRRLKLPRPLIIDGMERSAIIAQTVGADDYRFIVSAKGPC